ncbi:hypothetical protein, partial [Acidianus sp. RZ1]
FIELFFNREFLVGVLPLGMAGLSLSVTRTFYFLYLIGGEAYGFVFFLQFAVLILAIVSSTLTKIPKALLLSILYLTAFFDIIHVYFGINNTSFNLPIGASLAYVLLIIATSILIIRDINKKLLYVMIIPDILAFSFLIGSWLVEMTGVSEFGGITSLSARLMPYSLLSVGAVFVAVVARKINRLFLVIPLIISVPLAILAWFNVVPGLATMLGYTFPYILGILGVTDWFPPIFFVIASFVFFTSLGLLKIDKSLSLPVLGLLGGALVFDTISSTTYMLMPLIAVVLGSLSK